MPARTLRVLALLAPWLATGCAGGPGATGEAAAGPGPVVAAAATAPVPPVAEAPLPPLALAPRARWTRIRIDPRSGISAAWRASPPIPRPEGRQRRWIVADLKAPIRLPETGGQARSVAFLADYRCDQHAWEPVEIIWFAGREAQRPMLTEAPRGRGERRVAEGTLVDVFLDAACGPAAHPAAPGR